MKTAHHTTVRFSIKFGAFSDQVANSTQPVEVIERLHEAVDGIVYVLGAWRVPAQYDDWHEWKPNYNVFFQRDVSPLFFSNWVRNVREHGQSAIAAKALRDGTPFTWSQAMRDLDLSEKSRWIFDLVHQLGMRDGLCCPVGPWVLHYWTRGPFHPSPAMRSQLYSAAVLAVQQLMKLTAHKRLGGAPATKQLSPRELEVLRLYSLGSRPRQIAGHLGLQEPTIRDHLKHAQKKLGAQHLGHACTLAIRGRLF